MSPGNEPAQPSASETHEELRRKRTEHDRHSRSKLAALKGAAITFIIGGALVIVMALISLRTTANLPPGAKKSSSTVTIAVLGVFVSLAGSAFSAAAGQTRKRIETVESAIRSGKSDAEVASDLGLRPDTVELVRSGMPA